MKKFAAILLLVVLMLGVAGCGNNTASDSKAGEIKTLTWLVPGGKQPDLATVMEKVNEITREKIGAEIDLQFIDSAAYAERLRMNMASQHEFDICQLSNNIYEEAVKRGGLYDITAMIEGKDTVLNEIVPDYAWAATKIKDKIYAVPNVQIFAIAEGFEFRKDLVDKYNFDVSTVKSARDLEPYLQIIKENEPDVYPIQTMSQSKLYETPFTDFKSVRCTFVEDGSDQLYSNVTSPAFYESSKIFHEWYKKGYIRSDAATVTSDTSDYLSGKYAVKWLTIKPGVEAEEEAKLGRDLVVIQTSEPIVTTASATATMNAVSATSKNPELAFQFLELVNSDAELYNLFCFGVEGVHYEKLENGHIRLKENSGYAPNASWKFGCQFNAYLLENQPDGIWEETKALNDSAKKSKILGFFPDTSEIRTEVAQWTAIFNEYDKTTVSGSEDPDSYWSEFERRSKEAGVEKVEEEIKRQIKEFLETNTAE